jgi:hypothetical protein
MRHESDTCEASDGIRVILGASCYSDAEATLSLAVLLAKQLGAELLGVFVREEAALSASDRLRSCVVSYSGRQATGVTAGDMFSAFRADSRRFHRKLQNYAKEATLESAFTESKGRFSEAVQKVAKAGDFVVYSFKPVLQAGGSLALVLGEGQDIPSYVGRFARQLGKQIVVLMPGGKSTETTVHDPGSLEGGTPSLVHYYDRPAALLQRLEQMSSAATILAAPRSSLPPVGRLLEAARGPVILTGSTKPD